MLCFYGCGQEAKHQFKNGKWCCSKNISGCLKINEKQKLGNMGKIFSEERKDNISKAKIGEKRTEEIKENLRKINTGKLNPHYGKKHTEQTKKLFSLIHKLKINQIKKKYSFFSQIEEMRYNPNKLTNKEIQVRCKNHLCPNSKEQGGWFTPTRNQLYERIRQLESENGNGGCYFYCSDECKRECPLFNLKSDPLQTNSVKHYNQYEYKQFREYVLQRDKYTCQYCNEKAEHVHHERPQKLEPFYSLDPDLAWSVCSKCHYEKGHKDECSTGRLSQIIC